MSKPLPLQMLIVDSDPGVRRIGMAVASSLAFETAEAGRAMLRRPIFRNRSPISSCSILSFPTCSDTLCCPSGKQPPPAFRSPLLPPTSPWTTCCRPCGWERVTTCLSPSMPLNSASCCSACSNVCLRPCPALARCTPGGSDSSVDVTRLSEIERATIERVFHQVNGDKIMAGKLLGISRATLYRKLKRYQIGLRSPASRQEEAHA